MYVYRYNHKGLNPKRNEGFFFGNRRTQKFPHLRGLFFWLHHTARGRASQIQKVLWDAGEFLHLKIFVPYLFAAGKAACRFAIYALNIKLHLPSAKVWRVWYCRTGIFNLNRCTWTASPFASGLLLERALNSLQIALVHAHARSFVAVALFIAFYCTLEGC
jgi:hypothetical protein